MSSRIQSLVQESRNNLRIKENLRVRWQVQEGQSVGEGRVRNISASGMLLEVNSNFSPTDRCIFTLEPSQKSNVFSLPQQGRLVWSKKKAFQKSISLCGIQFIDPSQEAVSAIQEKAQKTVRRLMRIRMVERSLGWILVAVMTAMTAYMVQQYNENYQNTKLSHDMMVTAYQNQLTSFNSVKKTLVETQAMLAQLEVENADLKALVGTKDVQIKEFENTINELHNKNNQLTQEMAVLNERLRFLEGNINSLEEGRSFITTYRNNLHIVKGKIKGFKHEVYLAKVAAQAEKDRVESLLGNNGYFIKDGKPHQSEAHKANDVQIDVQFINN